MTVLQMLPKPTSENGPAHYMREIQRYPLLAAEEEAELGRRWRFHQAEIALCDQFGERQPVAGQPHPSRRIPGLSEGLAPWRWLRSVARPHCRLGGIGQRRRSATR